MTIEQFFQANPLRPAHPECWATNFCYALDWVKSIVNQDLKGLNIRDLLEVLSSRYDVSDLILLDEFERLGGKQ